jgi:cell division protein ZapA (FtsZ GTPase activity inhibitor)
MDELSIKVTISNRVYPLKINRQEEERVRKAAKLVNDRIKEYEQQFAGSDKYDHIAMCALQMATELVNLTDQSTTEQGAVSETIADIESRLSDYLLQSSNVH